MLETVLWIAAASLKAGTITVICGFAFALLFTVDPFLKINLVVQHGGFCHRLLSRDDL